MFGWIKEQTLPVVLAVLSFLLIIAGFFQISDITKLQIKPYPEPLYSIAVLGVVLMIVSVVTFLADKSNIKIPVDLKAKSKLIPDSVFFSAPMNAFLAAGRPQDYTKSREGILDVISEMKKYCGIKDVFYAGEYIKNVGDWQLSGESLKDDFHKIQEREFFLLFWPEKFASRSALVEAGIAITLNRKCVFFVKDLDDLPFLFQGVQNVTRNIKVIKYTDMDDLLNIIRTNTKKIFDFNKIN